MKFYVNNHTRDKMIWFIINNEQQKDIDKSHNNFFDMKTNYRLGLIRDGVNILSLILKVFHMAFINIFLLKKKLWLLTKKVLCSLNITYIQKESIYRKYY